MDRTVPLDASVVNVSIAPMADHSSLVSELFHFL